MGKQTAGLRHMVAGRGQAYNARLLHHRASVLSKRQAKYEQWGIAADLATERFASAQHLIENAAKIADRIPLREAAFDLLYSSSRATQSSRDEWNKCVRLGLGVQTILESGVLRGPAMKQLLGFVDRKALDEAVERVKSLPGTLFLVNHGGFSALVRNLFVMHFKNGIMIARGGQYSAMYDAGAALFAGRRALLEGQPVLISPDGVFGKKRSTIRVLGVDCHVAEGGPFLAYDTKCDTVWFTVIRSEGGFAPLIVKGPSRRDDENFPDFRHRFCRFYAEQLENALTGDPQSLPLTDFWIRYLSRLAKPLSRVTRPDSPRA